MIPAELLEKFVLYRMKEILTSDMYKEQFEQQITRELKILQTKKKDISKLKRDLNKLINQKEKLLNLIMNEEDAEIINTYKEKWKKVLSQITMQNNQLDF